MSDSDHIPLMFQAQVKGRSLIHKLEDLRNSDRTQQQAYDWAEQWQNSCDADTVPLFGDHIHKSKEYLFTWRMVTNSGQDEGVIRPVIGERGWAYFPGSSMKGAFLRACRQLCPLDEVQRYCGGPGPDGELHPGILRFHGGYPKNDSWLNDAMVDIVHPQENWQLDGTRLSHETPKVQISLYQPIFIFGISSTQDLPAAAWELIWQIWEKALERGIGSRVSAGYGQIKTHGNSKLLSVGLCGQGLASQRINRTAEFRPNVFKAALRGHTRRLLSGITDAVTAESITKQLWGGFQGKQGAVVGLLGIAFSARDLATDFYTYSDGGKSRDMPIYETGDAVLNLLLMRDTSEQDRKNLGIWTTKLVKFAMLVGGFGKSWRRVDHRLFSHQKSLPRYLTDAQNRNINPMIGCHWHLTEKSKSMTISVNTLQDITTFLDNFHHETQELLTRRRLGFLRQNTYPVNAPTDAIREVWRKGQVEVWGRLAKNARDSLAIAWFHGPYQGIQSIKHSDLTGWSSRNDRQPKTQIGRIWHRMYPRYSKQRDELVATGEYVELLTIFPNRAGNADEAQKTANFLKFLHNSTDFTHLW
jgi:CRISPR-associated protein Cmr6